MTPSKVLIFGCILILLVSAMLAALESEYNFGNGGRLQLIGKADGKTFYTDDSIKGTWVEWLEFCHDLAMYPGLIETQAQDLLIENYLRGFNLNGTSQEYIWLDGTDLFGEGNWHSIRTGQKLSYTNWHVNQPKATVFGRSANCLTRGQLGNQTLKWGTAYCFATTIRTRRVLCETP